MGNGSSKVLIIIAAALMILVGLFSLLFVTNLLTYNFAKFWPLFFLAIGVLLLIRGFGEAMNFIFGSTMALYGIILLLFTLISNDWKVMVELWPIFPLGLGISVFIASMRLDLPNEKLLFISAIFLISLGLWFLITNYIFPAIRPGWPIIIGIDGVLIMVNEFTGFLPGSSSGGGEGA